MAAIKAVTIVANDESEIQSKVDELSVKYCIDSSKVVGAYITHFGSNKYLITYFYKGLWSFVHTLKIGAIAQFKRVLKGKRAEATKLGAIGIVTYVHS